MGKKLQDRFSFLKEKFYKFISAIPKVGNKDFIVEFHCIKCGKDIRCSTASYSNLRRHINIKHSSVIKEYDNLWARNKTKRKHRHQDDRELEEKIMSPKQSIIGSFFGGPRVLSSPESPKENWNTNKDIQKEGLDDPFFEEEGMELYDTFEDNKQAEEEECDVKVKLKYLKGAPGESLKVRKVFFCSMDGLFKGQIQKHTVQEW